MGRLRSLLIPGVDKQLLVRDAVKIMPDLARRRFIAGGASLGALTLLTGCDVSDSFSAEEMLKQVSKFNDAVQALIFNPECAGADLSGKRDHKAIPVQRLLRSRRRARRSTARTGSSRCAASSTTRNRGRWRSSTSCRRSSRSRAISASRAGARSGAGPARRCAISSSWSAPTPAPNIAGSSAPIPRATTRRSIWRTALHPQTQMTFKFADEILPRAYGYPMKIRVPTKLGFKNPKYVISMEVTNDYKGGYWEDQGYNSFSGS